MKNPPEKVMGRLIITLLGKSPERYRRLARSIQVHSSGSATAVLIPVVP